MQKKQTPPLWPIIIVTALATVLRLTGYNWGLPFIFHPDEDRIVDGAWRAFWGFDAWESDYGMLPMRAIALIWKLHSLFDAEFGEAPTGPQNFVVAMIIARVLTACIGVATVVLVYAKSARHFGWQVGVCAATALALSPLHIQLSHFITVDIFLIFFVCLCFFGLLDYAQSPSRGRAALLGLWVGAALSTKMSALPLVPAALLTVLVFGWRTEESNRPLVWTAVDLVLAASIACCIYVFLQPESLSPSTYFLLDRTDPYWWNAFNFPQGSHKFEWNALMSRGAFEPLWTLASRLSISAIAMNLMWGFGVASLACLAGLFSIFRTLSNRHALLMLACFLLLSAAFLQSHIFFLRYAGPILPLAAIMAAIFFTSDRLPMLQLRRWAAILTGILSVFHASASASIYWQEDSRIISGRWVNEYLPEGSKICVEDEPFATPIIDVNRFEIVVMPIYKWDVTMRSQISEGIRQQLAQTNHSFEEPESWTDEESLSQVNSLISDCEFFIISDRMSDQVLNADASHPLQRLYAILLDPTKGSIQLQHFQVIPQVLGLRLADSWTEHTVRIFDHPHFRVVHRQPGALAL
jgi:hypothetical protein